MAYALHQTRYYVLGCADLIVATDHKPLLQILNDRSLTEITNRRLLNLKEKTLAYRFTLVHVPGKKNLGPDATSRHPSGRADRLHLPCEPDEANLASDASRNDILAGLTQYEVDSDIADDIATLAAATAALDAARTVVTWDMVREATTSDNTFVSLVQHLEVGFPVDCRQLPADLRPYHRFAASLCVVDGVVLMGQRVVIPPALRPSVLHALHAAHQGVNAMRARAMDSVYWPDITVDIARVRDCCAHCHRMAKSNPMQPPADVVPPDYPFQRICSDYFTYNGKDYLVIVDRYSNWPIAYKSESGADGLVKRLRETFVTFGIPEELTSDGGPQFTAGKTRAFLQAWGVRHRITSVANPHANCRAELAVKTVKRMLADNINPSGCLDIDSFQRAMLMYRNTVDPETKASPALILFGRPIRDAIPIPPGRYSPHETWQELMSHREVALAKRHSRERERWSEHTQRLPALRVGDHVYVQNLTGNHPLRWERTGTVVEVRQHHQYVVRVDGSGRVTLRNRQHLRRFTPFHTTPAHGIVSPERVKDNLTPFPVNRPAVSDVPPETPHAPVRQVAAPPAMTQPSVDVDVLPMHRGPQSPMPTALTRRPPMPARATRPPPATPRRLSFDLPNQPVVEPHRGPQSQSPMPTALTPQPPVPARATRPPPATPRRLSFDLPSQPVVEPPAVDTAANGIPRALARLLPHNQPGHLELLPPRRVRRDGPYPAD